jgi:hypothetical protein
MDLRTWPQWLFAASSLPMAALTAFAAWTFFFVPPGANWTPAAHLIVFANLADPHTLAMQVTATVGVYRQAKSGRDEPTARTRGLIGLSFLSLAGPVLVFLAYAVLKH